MSLKENLNNWIKDRAENNEPLLLNDFKEFMMDLEYDKKDIKTIVEKNKEFAKNMHKKLILKYKRF